MATRINSKTERAWLDVRSPMHEEYDWLWEQNERRYEGGHFVLGELWRFDWETSPVGLLSRLRDIVPLPRRTIKTKDDFLPYHRLRPGEHYRRRQESALYTNFMESYATDVVGHLMKTAPAPDNGLDFGTLGPVRRLEDVDVPSRSELLYYNTDGVGVDGSQWDSFWAAQMKLSMVTGYRWIMVEQPSEPARQRRRERLGFRPYLVPFSPRDVINHHYENGVLQYAFIKIAVRRPQLVKNTLEGNRPKDETLLFVRRGFAGFGDEFIGGGWWRFDSEKNLIGEPGTWANTDGEIPMTPLIYDRHPIMLGRPGLTELGNASIAAMNLHSCADFDAFDAVGSVIAVLGADKPGFNLFVQKVDEGNRVAPLPVNTQTDKTPSVQKLSQDAVSADVFEKRLRSLGEAVSRIRGTETASAPQASGLALQGGFSLGNTPRLSLFASNVEAAQNAILQWCEERFGETDPSGSVKWPRKYELIKLTSTAQAILQLQAIAGVHSEELEARVILGAAKDEGFVPDNAAAETIDRELRASRRTADQQAAEAATAKAQGPDVPGERRQTMPPEPANAPREVKAQLDGPNIP